MSTDIERGALSAEERALVYAHMKLSTQNVNHIEEMIAGSGKRRVGKAALTNVRVRYHSPKNDMASVVESHTCELVFAYELELDPDVLGYYVQVPCMGIKRTTKRGLPHISSAHLDFLVFRQKEVQLVECKTKSKLEEELAKAGSLWRKNTDTWSYPPYEEWASKHGLPFRVWVRPEPPGIYLQNLEACCAVAGDSLDPYQKIAVDKAMALVNKRPLSIGSIVDKVPGFNQRLALWMLAKGVVFGPWKSTSVDLADRFSLYALKAEAANLDQELMDCIASGNAQPEVTDPLLLATQTDLKKGRERMSRLNSIDAGHLPATRRMRQLAHRVRKAVSDGEPALSACLTRYANCGNRTSRLTSEQEQAIETVIAHHWNTGRARRCIDLVYEFENECRRLGVEPYGISRLNARRKSESPVRHAMATGGFRAYHAVRRRADPRACSIPPLGYGQVLHIDSSDLDVRCAPDLARCFPAAKAKFYIGIDGATGDTMAHSLIFGAARTDGLAVLLRECVRRHGFLPRIIHVDRGPENTSRWLEEFCEGRISIRHSPTAASAWNGVAENAIKQVNEQVAHRLVGSTAPDQKGRNVDGRFKSRSNARTAFTKVLDHFIQFIYEDLPNTPRGDGETPAEKRERAMAAYGVMGVSCKWNDDFLIRTSIALAAGRKQDAQRGICIAGGWFTSDELLEALRYERADQVRSDCCNPEVIYVRIAGRWLRAFHNRIQSTALLSDSEKLFELLWAPFGRSESRKKKGEMSRARYSRQKLAEIAQPATQHLAPPPAETEVKPEGSSLPKSIGPDDLDITPFDEREDF